MMAWTPTLYFPLIPVTAPQIGVLSGSQADFIEMADKDIPSGSPYRLNSLLLLIRREEDGEVWLTWNALEEHGSGSTDAEAKINLWENLCTYLESLQSNSGRLSMRLADDLQLLQQCLRQQ